MTAEKREFYKITKPELSAFREAFLGMLDETDAEKLFEEVLDSEQVKGIAAKIENSTTRQIIFLTGRLL